MKSNGETSDNQHRERVSFIQSQIRSAPGEVVLKKVGSYCSRSFDYKAGKTHIDASQLDHILEINRTEKFAVVEPLVTMETLGRATLPLGLIPPVLTEFRKMTLGGAIQGLGGESSSFKYGFIDDSVFEYEIVLGDGSVVRASKDELPDLFHSIPGSFGSFGIVTRIKLKLVNASKFVLVSYQRVRSIEQVLEEFQKIGTGEIKAEFIESLALSKNDFIIAKGYKTSEISFGQRIFRYCDLSHSWSPWYFHHILEKCRKSGETYSEFLEYEDYLFRWDRGIFWLANINKKHTLFNRLIYGSRIASHSGYRMLNNIPLKERDETTFLQDILVPMLASKTFFNYLDQCLKIYPLWLIPIRVPEKPKLFSIPSTIDPLYVDFGAWKRYRREPPPKNLEAINLDIERFLRETGGRKWLWSQNYCSEEEFWMLYDRNSYNQIRKLYHADGKFIDIYRKVSESRIYGNAK